ncbi:MAG: RidA family protein [Defluviitaleaceae bacterium]|nr:RidA family protein [Defluviitaleaceae bacterium]
MKILEKLKELGIEIKNPSAPLAKYVLTKQTGNLLYISGQLPIKDGELLYSGKLGYKLEIEQGKEAAKLCAINTLCAIQSHTDLENIKSFVKLQVFVNATTDFIDAPAVADGASSLFVDIFGDIGKHTRSAICVAQLPKNAAVEIDLIVELK